MGTEVATEVIAKLWAYSAMTASEIAQSRKVCGRVH
jgi:hypothetical protein